jgi:hypothetical protein
MAQTTCGTELEDLRSRLNSLIAEVEDECLKNRLLSRTRPTHSISQGDHSFKPRVYLEQLTTTIKSRKAEIERLKQQSSVRNIEDRIDATAKEIQERSMELVSLEKEGKRQEKSLAVMRSTPLIQDIERELGDQRKQNAELRRKNTEAERCLLVKQRICAQLEEQVATGSHIKSSRESVRSSNRPREQLENEVKLFEEEQEMLRREISVLRGLIELKA